MIRISDVKVNTNYTYDELSRAVCLSLHINQDKLKKISIFKRSLDARKRIT